MPPWQSRCPPERNLSRVVLVVPVPGKPCPGCRVGFVDKDTHELVHRRIISSCLAQDLFIVAVAAPSGVLDRRTAVPVGAVDGGPFAISFRSAPDRLTRSSPLQISLFTMVIAERIELPPLLQFGPLRRTTLFPGLELRAVCDFLLSCI